MDYRHANLSMSLSPAANTAQHLPAVYWMRGASWQMKAKSRNLWRGLALWQARFVQRRALAELDARQLTDIGISRAEALGEAQVPFWRKTVNSAQVLPLTAHFHRFAGRRRLAASYRRNYNELRALDGRTLLDAGIFGSSVRVLARQAAINDEIRWRRAHKGRGGWLGR